MGDGPPDARDRGIAESLGRDAVLRRFAPAELSRWVSAVERANPDLPGAAFEAVVMSFDVVGFSAINDRLEANHGVAGNERLVKQLDLTLGVAAQCAHEAGGVIIAFGGDAVTALWPLLGGDGDAEDGAGALIRAVDSGLKALKRMRDLRSGDEEPFQARVGIALGPVVAGHIGDEASWRRLIAVGPAIADCAAAQVLAAPGQIVVTPAAGRRLAGHILASPAAQGFARVDALNTPVQPWSRPGGLGVADPVKSIDLPRGLEGLIDADHERWLAEIRTATAMGFALPGIDCSRGDSLTLMKAATEALRRAVTAHGGHLEKAQADDKGFNALITFGLPPHEGPYKPDMALAAAEAIADGFGALGLSPSIGIATGRILRGAVGNELRGDYTVYGRAINRAVRLMQLASAECLCDQHTHDSVGGRHTFDVLPARRIKGFAEPVAMFRPIRRDQPGGGAARPRMVGRQTEIKLFDRRLDAASAGVGGLTLITGAAGYGKSVLIDAFVARATERGFKRILLAGDSNAATIAYYAWRPALRGILGVDAGANRDLALARAEVLLEAHPETRRLLPLLEIVVPLGLSDNDWTRDLQDRARALATRTLLARLLAAAARREPTLFVIDDGQWLDGESWTLVRTLAEDRAGAPILMAARTEPGARDPMTEEVESLPIWDIITLGPLERAETADLIAQVLGTPEAPTDLTTWAQRIAAGNPFLTSELATMLVRRGLVTVADGVATARLDLDAPASQDLPNTVEAMVGDRLDRMGPVVKLAAKTASVIGASFSESALAAVYPHAGTRESLPAALRELLATDLVIRDMDHPELYGFRHGLLREVVYQQLTTDQRRDLHGAAADHFAGDILTDPRAAYPRIALHLRRADRLFEALDALDAGSRLAQADGAFAVARSLLREALALREGDDPETRNHPVAVTDWRLRLARASLLLGDLGEAGAQCDIALGDLGHPLGKSAAGAGMIAAGHVLAYLLATVDRLRPARNAAWFDTARAAVQGAEILAEVRYFEGSPTRLLAVAALSARLAAESGQAISASRGYGYLIFAAMVFKANPLARRLLGSLGLNVQACGRIDDRVAESSAIAVFAVNSCDWDGAEIVERPDFLAQLELCDPYLANQILTLRAIIRYARGQFDDSAEIYEVLRHRALAQQNHMHLAWSDYGAAQALIALNRLEEALPLLHAADMALRGHADAQSRLILASLQTLAMVRLGDLPAAEARAAEALTLSLQTPAINYGAIEGYTGPIEAYLALAHAQPPRRAAWLKLARKALAGQRDYAALHRLGQPRLWLYRGYVAHISGRPGAARAHWIRAADWAARNRMDQELARACFALERHGGPEGAAAAARLASGLLSARPAALSAFETENMG